MTPLIFLLAAFAAAASADTPGQQKIRIAEATVAKDATYAPAFCELAFAYITRAHETADPSWLDKADAAIEQSLKLAPDYFEALKMRVMTLLGRRDFSRALELATTLNRRVPDDNLMYGLIADADIALGNYSDAEAKVQWMINMRRVNPAGYVRGAALRELFGDVDGAIELLSSAFNLISPTETEERAWILTQAARIEAAAGRYDSADRRIQQAMALFPDYPHALAAAAQISMGQNKPGEAAALLEKRLKFGDDLALLYRLAEARQEAGSAAAAKAAFDEFAAKARAAIATPANANRELILYLADRAGKPAEAVEVARQACARSHDSYTLDAAAWAFYRNGNLAEASAYMDRALAIGLRDPALLRHAETIKAGRKSPAQ